MGRFGDVDQPDDWDEPTPLTARLSPFPVAVLPPVLRDIVSDVATSTQTPADLAAFSALAALSAATRGAWTIRVSGSWSEETSLYVTALADSGARKTAVVRAIGHPLTQTAKELRAARKPMFLEDAAAYRIAQARARAAETAAAKITPKPDAETVARETARLAGEMKEPAEFRILADDVTPEALGMLMAAQGGPMAVLTAEGGLLGTLAGRYSDGRANVDLVLKAHDGESAWVDRVSREPLFIERPFLALGIIAQPDVIVEAVQVKAFTERGLLPRMLFALPSTTVGTRELNPPDVPDHVANAWYRCIDSILRRSVDLDGEQTVMHLDEDAFAILTSFREDLEPRLHPDIGDLHRILAWASKLPGALVRIAALFALAEDVDARQVQIQHMTAAVALSDYLIEHTRAVLALDLHRRNARQVSALTWIRRKTSPQSPESPWRRGDTGTFTARDAWQGLRGRAWADTSADVQTVLDELVDLGWLRRCPEPPRRAGRPPSPTYQAHPRLLDSTSPSVQVDPRRAA